MFFSLKDKLKTIIKLLIYEFKSRLFLNRLNSIESKGKIFFNTNFKFVPKTNLIIPFHLGRSRRGIAFDEINNLDPYGKIYFQLINGQPQDLLIDKLSKLIYEEKNTNASEIMNCLENKTLKRFPAWAHVMPWDDFTYTNKFQSYYGSLISNRSDHGASFVKAEDDIYINSYAIARSHIEQCNKLIKSINMKGIINNLDMPRIHLLIKGNEWRWYMTSEGNHRVNLFYLMGYEKFSAVISSKIYRNKVQDWFNVKNETYTIKEALMIFDNIFEGSKYICGMI